jgi:hypothetical protein
MTDRHPIPSLHEVALERRAREADDDVWARRRAGRLGADEERMLAERAASDPFVAHMLALTEPASAARHDRLASLLTDAPQPRRSRSLVWAGAVAACAAIALLVVTRAPESTVLPPYEGTLQGVDKTMRAAGDQPAAAPRQRISRGARLELIAEPIEPLATQHASLAAALFLERDGHVERVTVPVEVGPNGAARLLAGYDAVFGARTGAWDLVLFVGAADRVPQHAAEAVSRLDSASTDVQVVRFPVELTR